jgi:hypothetical protein
MFARLLSRALLVLGLACGAVGLARGIFGVAIGFPSGPQLSLAFVNETVAFVVGVVLIAAGVAIGMRAPRSTTVAPGELQGR